MVLTSWRGELVAGSLMESLVPTSPAALSPIIMVKFKVKEQRERALRDACLYSSGHVVGHCYNTPIGGGVGRVGELGVPNFGRWFKIRCRPKGGGV